MAPVAFVRRSCGPVAVPRTWSVQESPVQPSTTHSFGLVSVTLPVTLALTLALATVTPVLVVGAAGRWLFWRDNRADGQIESRTSPGW